MTAMSQNTTQQLIDAIKAGDKSAVERLLEEDANLIRAAANGTSAILLAAYNGRRDVAQVFVESGAMLDIYEACALGSLERVREIVRDNPGAVNSFAPDGFFPLGLAAFFGHGEIVRLLLENGAQATPAARNAQRVTALHGAVARGDGDIVKMLLEHGADPNARQESGFVPLHEAAANGKEAIARLLVEHGARVDAAADDGKTAYDLATQRGQKAMAEWLQARARRD
jgi:ankyrin repeat protein